MLDFLAKWFKRIFGTGNDRIVKRLRVVAEKAGELAPKYRALSDEELKGCTEKLRARLKAGETLADILPDAFAVCREGGVRFLKMRHFDSQFIGGQVLNNGSIAEMATGEGKTLVATLPCYLNALAGKKVHVWSVNDYLVKRDRDWMAPLFEGLGLTVGAIQSQMGSWGEGARLRQKEYACDITYGTNNELGFDYLRDNMKIRLEDQVQGRRDYSIVDEADSILIDEARTPLIISGPAADDTTRYAKSDEVVRKLIQMHKPYADAQKRLDAAKRAIAKAEADVNEARRQGNKSLEEKARKALEEAKRSEESAQHDVDTRTAYYEVELDRHTVRITHEGIGEAQRAAGVGSFYVGSNMEWPHLMEQSLKAHLLYEKDKNYVVQDGEVKIVDEFTGRVLEGRQWSDGLHQAVEAKERVKIKEETQTLATITIQNFAKLYSKISGMTGTAMTEAEELAKIYGVDVVSIPTNRPVNRMDHHDLIYQAIPNKYDAIVEEVHDVQQRGRPHNGLYYHLAFKGLERVYALMADHPAKLHAKPPENASGTLGRIREVLRDLPEDGGAEESAVARAGELYDEILGEITHGRPVLVGTTSIEKSEKLSAMLSKRYGIEHQVLNAKPENAHRESEIVAEAGRIAKPKAGKHAAGTVWGTVTIATNMAGRGTDIKLGEGVVYRNCKGDLGPVSSQTVEDGKTLEKPPPANADGAARRFAWHEPAVSGTKCCINCPDYDPATNCAHCFKPKLDARFPEFGRKVCPVSPPCGLHIVGTERHESRRIDNQLRGRAGRQGDPGASLFFLSLEDELLKTFMPEWTIRALKWLGLKEGEAIQDKRVTKGIERAQKKVEERHFNSRKHLLEYDEVNNQQRKIFYTRRQAILEGRDVQKTIRAMIDETIDDAVREYYDPQFLGKTVAEWAKTTLRVQVDPYSVRPDMSAAELERVIRDAARDRVLDEETGRSIGEHIDAELDRKEWDIAGLSAWAMAAFGVNLPGKQKLLGMEPAEIEELIKEEALKKVEAIDCTPAVKLLSKDLHTEGLVRWANGKFAFDLKPEALKDKSAEQAAALLKEEAGRAFERREIEQPIGYALAHYEHLGVDTAEAAVFLSNWARNRYQAELPPDNIKGRSRDSLAPELRRIAEEYCKSDKLEKRVAAAVGTDGSLSDAKVEELVKWADDTFGAEPDKARLTDGAAAKAELVRLGRGHLRQELSKLEQRLLLDTYDRAWKDHLYNMDFLKENVGLQGWAERDPKNVYKKEGYEMFVKTLAGIRDRITSRVFKLEVSDEEEMHSIYQITSAIHSEFRDLEMQQQAAMEGASAGGQPAKVAQIVIEGPKVGRNDPCWCGSGKKFKKCHGKTANV